MKEQKKYRFYTEEDGPEEAIEFLSIWGPEDGEYIAQDAGAWLRDQYDTNKDPGEWPVVLTVEAMDGETIGTFSVSMEYQPQFSASKTE